MSHTATPGQHGTRWTVDEHQSLSELWTGRKTDTETIAEMLGRTRKACEAHWYGTHDGTVPEPAQLKPDFDPTKSHVTTQAYRTAEYLGVLDEDGDRWWDQDWSA